MGPVVIGIDVGQRRDPTAIVVAEIVLEDTGRDTITARYADGSFDRAPETHHVYVVRHLERIPLMTDYPSVATRLVEIVAEVKARDPERRPWVLADATGVGRPIIDMLEDALHTQATLTAVTFTGSDRLDDTHEWEARVGKEYFASRLKALTQTGRIRLPDTAEARQLADELQDYELRLNSKANAIFGAFKQGTHDDLVTALGLAVLDDTPFTQGFGLGPRIWA